jgi:hypothetical protein
MLGRSPTAKNIYIYIYIFLLTAIGLPPGGSSTVHIYTQNNTKQTIYIDQHKNFGGVRHMLRLLYNSVVAAECGAMMER